MTPIALWTHVLLKSGEAMLDSMQNAMQRHRRKVAVIPTADAPPQRAPVKARRAPAKAKARATPKRKRARSRSAKASARRR